MTKKILFIVTQSEFGGAQHFLAHLVTALDKNRYNIIVAAGPEGDDEKGLLSFLEKKGINAQRLAYLRRSINPIFDFLGLIEIYKLIKKERPNTVFLCSSKAGALGSFATVLIPKSYTLNPKVIYRIGGWTFNDPHSFLWKGFYKFIEKFSARWKDIIIVNAECHRKQAIELGIRPRKGIFTIYNGLDISKLEFLSREEARERLLGNSVAYQLISPSTILVGTIANLYPAKGLGYLIEAARIIKDRFVSIKFIVIGEGMERSKLEELIKKYNLGENFFLFGAVIDAYKYLKVFDIFALSSLKEGFPWTILEAMAAEVPIIATSVGAVPEIIENKKTGFLVKPGDAKELSKAIIGLLEDYSLRVEMAKNAKIAIGEKFSLEKMVREVEKLL